MCIVDAYNMCCFLFINSFMPLEGRSMTDGRREGKKDLSGAVRVMRILHRGCGSGQANLMGLCS